MSMRNIIEMSKKHLTHMKVTNEKHDILKAKREEFLLQSQRMRRHLNSVKILSSIISNCRASYSNLIIESIEVSLTNCLDVILQDKKYDIDIEIYDFRGDKHLRARFFLQSRTTQQAQTQSRSRTLSWKLSPSVLIIPMRITPL